jgi:hypothetical protein
MRALPTEPPSRKLSRRSRGEPSLLTPIADADRPARVYKSLPALCETDMPYAIDKQKTFDLVGGSAEDEFDVGSHDASRTVHVARSASGTIKLDTWGLASDGTFTPAGGAGAVVGHGTRTRIVVFDNHRIVVLWLDASSTLRARAYNSGGDFAGAAITIETTIASFDLASIGVTTGVQQPVPPGTAVWYAFRQFAFTTLSENGGWKLWLGSVTDSCEVTAGPVALGGPGDKVALSCATQNEIVNGAHPRTALTLWRDAGQIKTRSWRIAYTGVTALASAAETKPLGIGIVYGMSIAQGNDLFATAVWPGASNATARLQLVSLATSGAMSVYGSVEIAETPRAFARLGWYGSDAAVAYTTPEGHLAVAAWRFAAPGSNSATRTVLAAKAGTEQPTQVRIASLLPASGSDDDPVSLVTLSHAAGSLRLVSWRLHKTVDFTPIGSTPIGIGTKP